MHGTATEACVGILYFKKYLLSMGRVGMSRVIYSWNQVHGVNIHVVL